MYSTDIIHVMLVVYRASGRTFEMTSHSFQHEILEQTFPVEGRKKGKVPVFNYAVKHCALMGMG
jgi:hypothetical protein